VLARPQIRTKPGERAIFQSGGEIPIRNAGKNGGPTVWKNYGLLLTLVPDAQVETGSPEIAVEFKLELSEPDYSAAIDGVPGMKVRRLESRFDLRTAETTILTTLVQTRTGKESDGLYGTRSVPLLQHLFGSQTRTDQDSELWFAIRPVWEEIHDEP
jgi:pilus assembly protein CpaC